MGRPLKNRVFVKTKAIVVIAIVLIFGLLVLNMLIVHWEHAKSHKVKTSVAKKRLEIPLREELFKNEPNNYQAWRELGKGGRGSFDFPKARESWG